MSNSLQFVDRERLHGTIDGVDFGYNLSCIVRSPEKLLLWSGGTAYTSGRQTQYGESCLYLMDRKIGGQLRGYARLGSNGGRLSVDKITQSFSAIASAFGEDSWGSITKAVRERKTLLIEGGGGVLAPSIKLGQAAIDAWKDNPNKSYT